MQFTINSTYQEDETGETTMERARKRKNELFACEALL